MVEIIETAEGLAALKSDWERLEQNPQMRIFQRFAWCHAAWTEVLGGQRGNRLWVAKWSAGDDSVILPTYIDVRGTLRFIFDDDSDIGDAVYAGGRNHHIAYQEIAKAIQSESCIRRVHLQKLYGPGEALNYLSVLLRPAVVYKDNAYSWLDVVPSDDFVVAQLHMRSKDRADLKNLRKKAEAKYTLRVVSQAQCDSFPEMEMRALRAAMRKAEKRTGNYFPDEDIAFVRRIYEAGLCEVAILADAQGLQALNVILVSGSRKLSWVFFYADPRSGTALYLLYLSRQHANPLVFDFGVGVYSYKIGTFRPMLGATFSLRYAKGNAGWIKDMVQLNLRYLKDFIKAMR